MEKVSTVQLSAVIIAAGFSSRMPTFKPLMRLDDRTVLETTVSKFVAAEIEDIIVVLGYRSEDLIPLIERLRVKYVVNHDFESGMYTSIQEGVRALDPSAIGFFIMPADMPLIKTETLLRLAETYDGEDVLYPSMDSRRGHPPLINQRLIADILSCSGEGGLKAVLKLHAKSISHLEVADRGILMDMDNEEDYLRILEALT